MAKKAIFFPVIIGNITAYLQNMNDKLTTGGLAVKYATAAAFKTKLLGWLTSLPAAINKAFNDAQTAQQSTTAQNELIAIIKTDVLKELNRIENETNFDEADMEALGARIDRTPPDLATVKPKISHITIQMNQGILDWIKGGMEGVIIYGSYNGSTWTEIGRDLKSPYEDTRSNQAAGVAETRYYKMRYMKNDQPIGLESDVVKVVVDIA